MQLYQTAARAWLTAALASLLLPASWRLGLWLPLHLALAGAASVAIGGAMQTFAAALTATAGPGRPWVLAQFGLANAGVAGIAVGHPAGWTWLVAAGGLGFATASAILGAFVWRARRRSLHRRHRSTTALYLIATLFVMVGGVLGALLGSGAGPGAAGWLALRRAHMTLNVLGWVSLTIVATLVTLLPTVLRVRMPVWRGPLVGGLLVAGVSSMAIGFAFRVDALAATGAVTYAVAALAVVAFAIRVMRVPRRWTPPLAAKHLLCALAWFVVGDIALAVAVVRGPAPFDAFGDVFLVVFAGGWIVQTLLGAWSYLLPMATPGHPDERRAALASIEVGGDLQVLALNAGLLLMAFAAAGWLPQAANRIGAGLALAGGAVALAKVWAFGWLARLPFDHERARGVWGG